jgi:hypothetical protein
MSSPSGRKAIGSVLAALVGVGALASALVAALTTWWLLTDPGRVVVALESRDLMPLFYAIARRILDALLTP